MVLYMKHLTCGAHLITWLPVQLQKSKTLIQVTGQCGKQYFNTHSTLKLWGKHTYSKSNTFNFSFICCKSKPGKLIFLLWLLLKSLFPNRLHLLLCSPKEISQRSKTLKSWKYGFTQEGWIFWQIFNYNRINVFW